MPIIAGIYEAGDGPLPGPLVVSRVALRCVRPIEASELWDGLADGVARQVRGGGDRVVVADSKTLYSPRRGFSALEENVLALLG